MAEHKVLLLRSVAQYLERCGFSKCFKKLLSEAQIEKKELNSTLPNLEEIYSEFLKKTHHEAVELKNESVEDEDKEKKAGDVNEIASVEQKTNKKDKKKKKKDVEVNGVTEATAMEGIESVKEKKKKKKETKVEVTEEKVKETEAEMEDGVKEKKNKKKKNKTKSIEVESLGDDDNEKLSKKRKRSEPEETKEQTEGDDEESKRRKKEENAVEGDESVQETPVKQKNIEENGNIEKSEKKSTNQKSGKGLSNSKEPNKPFQRVNVEDVVFTDDRLKDNSYWAKDGADSGYGAKAQEVLGQVRGRGFRHEKTKKKRGSYRGGEIDLNSHSVKFDYSDEE